MKGMAIVDKGLEDIASTEINEKIKSKGNVKSGVVIFNIKKEEELCKLAYTCQSVRRILLLITEFKVEKNLNKSMKLFENSINKTILKKYSKNKIKVECERFGEHDFNSVDFAKETSDLLKKYDLKASRVDNNLEMFIYIDGDKGYLCIDFSGRDLSKRDYRIFTKAGSLKGTLAYAMVRLAKYKPGEIIVDPYCETGVISIEATLMALKKPVHYYKKEFAFKKINKEFEKVFKNEDKKIEKKVKGIWALDKTLGNINSAKKNSKIAGVDKIINFSKADIEWLDTKFEEKSVDKIIVKLPAESKKFSKNIAEKIYKELFYQAEFILKDKGLIVVDTLRNDLLKEVAKKKNFKLMDEKNVFSGQQKHIITVFGKIL